jgi:hypothetical protein
MRQSREIDTGGSKQDQSETDELNTLEMIERLDSSSVRNFLKENPEILVAKINQVLEWISVTEGWFLAISQIPATNGTILTRITIAPPENLNLKVLEDKNTESKELILEFKK